MLVMLVVFFSALPVLASESFIGSGGAGCTSNCTLNGTTTGSTINALQYQVNGMNMFPLTSLTNTASFASIVNTAVETFFGIFSNGLITAGKLNTAGVRLETDFAGVYGTNGVTDTINLKLKLCTVSGCGSGTVVQIATTGTVTPGVATSNQGWNLRVACVVLTTGVTGTLDCQGMPGALFFTALTTSVLDDVVNTASSTIDTTVSQYVSLSLTFNNASLNNTMTLRNMGLRIY